jgi:hypothetical protein
VTEPLPELLDAKALRSELGISRAAAEKIMRLVPAVVIPGLLEERTFEKDRVVA